MKRRSASSKYALIGDSQIPTALGQTITGALANIPFPFGIDATTGEYGYKKAGADTVVPFKSGLSTVEVWSVYYSALYWYGFLYKDGTFQQIGQPTGKDGEFFSYSPWTLTCLKDCNFVRIGYDPATPTVQTVNAGFVYSNTSRPETVVAIPL